jgi:hypothetical protein
MGRRIRIWEPNIVYSAVIRCVDQQFLLKPDHDLSHPLLQDGCPVESLDRNNDITPQPSTINIIGAAAARALQLAPIDVHWVDANINHLEVGFSAGKDQIENISRFFQILDSIVAVRINIKLERKGHVWGAPFRPTPCLDDRSAEQQLIYCLTNPVKDHLVETVRESPFFTCYRNLAHGEPLEFFWIDWDAYFNAGGPRKKSHRPKDYLSWLSLELTPLPHQADWPEHKRQTWIRQEVRAVEQRTRDELRSVGRKAMGSAAQFAVDPRDRPADPKNAGPQPLCHATDPETRRAYRHRWRETVHAHRAASIDYRLGYWEREFPEGTFRPPLITPYSAAGL